MIIAVDFDGVLCKSRFPRIGESDASMIQVVKNMRKAGHEVILWTCRKGERLKEAVEWCELHGLEFDAVNDNAPSNRAMYEKDYPQTTCKVHADIYVDDHNLGYSRDTTLLSLRDLCSVGEVHND